MKQGAKFGSSALSFSGIERAEFQPQRPSTSHHNVAAYGLKDGLNPQERNEQVASRLKYHQPWNISRG